MNNEPKGETDAPCCKPDDGEEHCNHHPEWHDGRGCNHPNCRPTPPGTTQGGAS